MFGLGDSRNTISFLFLLNKHNMKEANWYIVIIILLFVFLTIKTVNTPSNAAQIAKIRVNIIYEYEYFPVYKDVIGTVYHAKEEQTDKTPYITATGEDFSKLPINTIRWCALSRDLLNRQFIDKKKRHINWGGKINLHDTIWINSDCNQINGWWVVKDVMGKYYINLKGDTIQQNKRIDFLQDYRDTTSFLLSCKNITIQKRRIKGAILEFK